MKSRRIILLIAALVLCFATISYADSIDYRINRAYAHIDRGIQAGTITRDEAYRLKGELRDIREDEARMLRDGRLSHHERARLDRELDRLERHIYKAQTNDNSRVYGGRGDDDRRHDRGRDDRDYDDRGRSHNRTISVVAGTYGSNCGAGFGNVTAHLASQCNGQRQCNYRVDFNIIGDPARGCAKNYVAQWRCGNGPVQTASASPEAGLGSVITLSCQ